MRSHVIELVEEHRADLNLFGLDTNDIRPLLQHCLQNNYLRFGDSYFKQTQGLLMGSRIAPTLVIVFMGSLEKQFWNHPRGVQSYTCMR